jgi:predicted enzyme related to lactoylglutathione lyase
VSMPVSYVELHSPDLAGSAGFLAAVFGWQPQAFAAPDYLVAPHGDRPGIDAGILASRDGQPRAVPVIRVDALAETLAKVSEHGGTVVVEPFAIPGVGQGCYVVDPAGVLIGVHHYDPDA